MIRLSAMGDVAMVPHSLRALRENYPDLKITVLTRKLFTPLFDGLGVEILNADVGRGGEHHSLVGISRLVGVIKELGVDCVADMHGIMRTNVLVTQLRFRGVKVRQIKKGRVTKWLHMDGGCNAVTQPLKHTVERYCDVLRALGFELESPTPAVKRERPNPLPYAKGEERWIGIAPFSIHEGKRYPLHLVRRVVAGLTERYDRVFIHSGGGDELKFAEELAAEHESVTAVFSQMKLKGEIDLISMLDCLITMDSFAMHVASLTATPVVSVWGATHPMLGFSGYGSDPRGVLQLDMKCRPCSTYGNKPCRFHDYRCLHSITPEMVLSAVSEMVSEKELSKAENS
ncbi:MAG: glycosyltransferase family 9 protein [Rikenellaceae bacterium]